MQARAFSLVELMVAVAIAGAVSAAAIMSVVAVSSVLGRTRDVAVIDDNAKQLTEFFVASVQGAGGKGIRPWAGLQVVDRNNPTTGSDTLIIVRADPVVPECAIVGRPGAGAVMELAKDETGTICCNTAAHANRKLMIVTPDGNEWGVAVSNNSNTSSCHVNFPPGGGGVDVDATMSKLPSNQDNFVGGLLVVATSERWFRTTANELIRERDDNDDGVISADERIVAAEDVFDFQVAEGYDVDGDGIIFDDGGPDDEWFGNNAGDTKASGVLQDVPVDRLRMLQIGVIVGVPDGSSVAAPAVSLLDGPARSAPGTLLRAANGRAYLRNLLTFL